MSISLPNNDLLHLGSASGGAVLFTASPLPPDLSWLAPPPADRDFLGLAIIRILQLKRRRRAS